MKRSMQGFTLLEVMVALGIFAVVAASVLVASARSVSTASALEDKTLASWLADNHLTTLQLASQPPSAGEVTGQSHFAGRQWYWLQQTQITSEPTMRRVTLWVATSANGSPRDHAVVSLSAFVEAP